MSKIKVRIEGGRLEVNEPCVMGVLNVTPDSFSDGGRFSQLDKALSQAEKMWKDGAQFIDVGGESTRPGANVVTVHEELDRVCPIVEAISSEIDVLISLDTSTPEVMKQGVSLGAHLINDVRALQKPGAIDVVRQVEVPVCIMHMQGEPQTMQKSPSYSDVVENIVYFFENSISQLQKAGIARDRLLIDPGFGFGKRLDHNLTLLNSLEKFCDIGLPLLVGISRKSMLGQITGKNVDDRLAASLAAATIAVYNGASIIRAHDVAETVDAVKVATALMENCDD